jgi:hypothetical protein
VAVALALALRSSTTFAGAKPSAWASSKYPSTPQQQRSNSSSGGGGDLLPRNAHTLRLYLKKYAFIVKLLCLLDCACSVFRCFTPNGFWLGSGVVFAPLGFVGALRFRRAFVLAYAAYCVVEVGLTLLYAFLNVADRTQELFFLLSALGEAVVFWYVWLFFRAIPVEEAIVTRA